MSFAVAQPVSAAAIESAIRREVVFILCDRERLLFFGARNGLAVYGQSTTSPRL